MAKGKHSYAKQRKSEQEELSRRKRTRFKETLKELPKRYFIDAMGAMALGLFASLLIGTIFGTVSTYIPWDWLKDSLNLIATFAKQATGMAIGVAIAYKLGAHPLVIFSCAGVGALSAHWGSRILQPDQ